MPRPLLPPNGIYISTGLAFDKTIPPAARDTWLQLRALAWGKLETPPFSAAQFEELTGKSRSTLYGHLRILRYRSACTWRALSNANLVVSFNVDESTEPAGAASPAAVQSRNLDNPESRILDLPNLNKDQDLATTVNNSAQSRNLDLSKKLDSSRNLDASKKLDSKKSDLLFEALSDLTGLTPPFRDWQKLTDSARGKLNRAAAELRKVTASPEQVRAFWTWWKRADFRGKQGQRPEPADVTKKWSLYLNDTHPSANYQPGPERTDDHADAARRDLAARINARRSAQRTG